MEVMPISFKDLKKETKEEASSVIRKRVEAARARQAERYKGTVFSCNSELSGGEVKKYCVLTEEAKKCMEAAYDRLAFSARSYHRILKTARTVADLAEAETIDENHIAEALLYREPDRKYWGE
jgi:magnesium chelatase family protein